MRLKKRDTEKDVPTRTATNFGLDLDRCAVGAFSDDHDRRHHHPGLGDVDRLA
jgi:hypothetical protein